MRVSCRRSVSSQRSICSAQGESSSSLGASTCRGPERLSVASAASCSSLGSGPSGVRPAASAASM